MTIAIAVVLLVLVSALLLLALTRIPPDAIFMAALIAMLALPVPIDGVWQLGLLTIEDGVRGFANPGVLTIAEIGRAHV